MTTQYWFSRAAAEDPTYRRQLAHELLAHRKLPPYVDPSAPGHVVEFVKSGKPRCGVLLRRGHRADRLLDADGKEEVVDHAKIMGVSSAFLPLHLSRSELVRALREIDRERERLKGSINPYELWEVVEPEGREWKLEELTALYFVGPPGPHGEAALFRALEEGRAFRRRGQAFVPLRPEQVAQNRQEEQGELAAAAWLQEAAAWLRRAAAGEEAAPPPDSGQALDLLATKVLFGPDHPHAEEASTLARLAHLHSSQAIFRALVQLGYWSEDENLDLWRHEIPVEFTEPTLAEAETTALAGTGKRRPRVWFRRVYSFLGDEDRYERAFSIRPGLWGFTVGVHLASPALLIPRGGLVQQAAGERGAALRLPDRWIPLLPPATVAQAALTGAVLRPTLTLHLRFDRRFELQDFRFAIDRTRVTRALSREEANARAEHEWGLRHLYHLAQHLRQRRLAAGAVIFPDPEIDVRVREGEIRLQQWEPHEPARLIEQELSILTNTLAGRWCLEQGLPAVYQGEDPGPEILVDPDHYDPLASYRQRRLLPPVWLEPRPGAHHGLGAPVYVPVDAPQAGYTDLLMHQQILGFLDGEGMAYTEEDLRQAILYTTYARTTAREIERKARRYWLLRYLEQHVGEEREAVVLAREREGYRVELSETRLWAVCPAKPRPILPPGTPVRVRLTRVSAREEVIRLELVDSGLILDHPLSPRPG